MTNLADFLDELDIYTTYLNLSAVTSTSTLEKHIFLELQALNKHNHLVWLKYKRTIGWANNAPITPRDQSIYDGMFKMHDLVKEHLQDKGYQIRHGSYAIPNSILSLPGTFDCVHWTNSNFPLAPCIVKPNIQSPIPNTQETQ
jgi:hypothetical protein